MKKKLLSAIFIFLILNTFAQLNMESLGFLPYNQSLSDIWGYVDTDGNEYALVGVQNGFSVVDVTTPSEPVEVFFGPGVNSIWRDIKTWGNHAYVSTEGGDGIYIVDLSPLPGTITNFTSFTGSDYPFTTVHNLYIDETGKLYIFGADSGEGGAIICDLTNDPMNPEELGRFDDYYFHDGMARGDTLWGGAIYEGFFAAVDVSDPANPQVMATKSTPNQFTHNVWVSDNGKNVYTSDEVGSAYIGAYDVSDFNNIIETDRIQSSPGNNVIPHNVHVLNDYLITSYYSDGVTVHDVARPTNLIEVGNYDTSPNFPGPGYHGSWGAFPFLPSGNILASDIEEGLYILGVEYTRGCYLEGNVTDSITGLPINNVMIKIASTEIMDITDFTGSFAFGTPTAGTYNIEFSHEGYNSKIIEGVILENGVLTNLEVELSSWFTSIGIEIETAQITVGPNPFTNTMKLKYHLDTKISSSAVIQIFSINGVVVEEVAITEQEATITIGEHLKAGIYYVRLMNKTSVIKPILIRKL
ncbi:MAG: choice-of-anchor B family protein [Bacteroidota bacterium]